MPLALVVAREDRSRTARRTSCGMRWSRGGEARVFWREAWTACGRRELTAAASRASVRNVTTAVLGPILNSAALQLFQGRVPLWRAAWPACGRGELPPWPAGRTSEIEYRGTGADPPFSRPPWLPAASGIGSDAAGLRAPGGQVRGPALPAGTPWHGSARGPVAHQLPPGRARQRQLGTRTRRANGGRASATHARSLRSRFRSNPRGQGRDRLPVAAPPVHPAPGGRPAHPVRRPAEVSRRGGPGHGPPAVLLLPGLPHRRPAESGAGAEAGPANRRRAAEEVRAAAHG
jgi:hypothetical protein